MARFGVWPVAVIGLLLVASAPRLSQASPADDNVLAVFIEEEIHKRGTVCGYYGTLTCSENQYCYTDSNNGWALCGYDKTTAAAAAGETSYQLYTTTYVETDYKTVTSTWSVAVATATSSSCKASLGETACGSTCCAAEEYCVADENYCAGGGSSAYYSTFWTYTTAASESAPARGTTVVGVTVTSTGTLTGSATTTEPYSTPVSTGNSTVSVSGQSSSNGLSGGAIAGIVVGVIFGLLLLLLLCLCCCAKAGIDGILALFGLRNRDRRRTEETYIEERHSHRTGRGAAGRRTWFGTRPSRTSVVEERRRDKSSGFGGLAGVTAGLVALAAVLGLKRRRDHRDDKSEYTGTGSYSYYTYSDTSASSESSDDRRTHRTHHTQRSSRH